MGIRRKAIVAACLLTGAGGALAGCGGSSSSSTTTIANTSAGTSHLTIDYVCATPAFNSFFAPIEDGAKDAGREVGVTLNYTGLGTTFTPAAQAQVLQAAVNQHPDAIVACEQIPQAGDPILRQAVKEGIPVIGSASGLPNMAADGAIAEVGGADPVAGGQIGADKFLAAGVKHPLCVDHVPTVPEVVARCTGFVQEFKAHGISAQVLNMPITQYADTTAEATDIKGALAANSSIDGVFVLGPQQAVAAVNAVDAMGRASSIKVGTFDMSTQILNYLKGGQLMFALWQQPYLDGYLPVVLAAEYLRHHFPIPVTVRSGPEVVTKANNGVTAYAEAHGLL